MIVKNLITIVIEFKQMTIHTSTLKCVNPDFIFTACHYEHQLFVIHTFYNNLVLPCLFSDCDVNI